jgi:rare lipoprotein A
LSLQIKLLNLTILIATIFSGCGYKGSQNFTSTRYGVGSQKVIDSANMHKATMRPYKIKGTWYYPYKPKVGTAYHGVASWYGPNFHSKKTSNGEYYNMYALTAAHKTLPMNTLVKVINKKNSKNVVVRINDRGPFVDDRIIDLSKAAADRLDVIKSGTANVKLIVIGYNNKVLSSGSSFSQGSNVKFYKPAKTTYTPKAAQTGKYAVQLGSFSNINRANNYKDELSYLETHGYALKIKEFTKNSVIYKLWLTGFQSRDEAVNFVKKKSIKNYFIVKESIW